MSGERENGPKGGEQKADVYHKLAVFVRGRYESARILEWKINIGLWTLFVVGSGFVVSAVEWKPTIAEAVGGSFIAVLILVAYVSWLVYLHEILQRDNRTAYWWESHLEKMTGTPRPKKLRPQGDWNSAYDDPNVRDRDVSFGFLHKLHWRLLAITLFFSALFIGSLWTRYFRPAAEAPPASVVVEGGRLEFTGDSRLRLGQDRDSGNDEQ